MFFQPLDKKQDCRLFYYNNDLHENLPDNPTYTWKYVDYVSGVPGVKFAQLLCAGQDLNAVCPESLRGDLERTTRKLKSYLKSFHISKVNLDDVCFFDLTPESFLLDYFDVRNEITKHVVDKYEEPKNYKFLADLSGLSEQIRTSKLNIQPDNIAHKLGNYQARQFMRKINNSKNVIDYNIFGTITGRLATNPGSFPIMTLNHKFRSVLVPNNDLFVELDYNAAELRVFLALLGIPQPTGDIHTWIAKNVFKGALSRDAVKKKVFAWLYNPQARNSKLESIFNKNKILEKYYDGESVRTVYGRTIKADLHHALNYIIQSTTSDLFLRQVIETNKIFKDKKSYISFSIHDSFVIDASKDDIELVKQATGCFSATPFGHFKSNLSIGKDFGNMVNIDTI
tara:strand:+ start:10 stop:1200 length:1191 start_codon:yes stop_codon:yes gene_type:complete